jgi:peptidoglycan/LPS O-acetylase OafA/YrhL
MDIFSNYQLVKLIIPFATLQNLILLLILLAIAIATRRKENTKFLDQTQTDQLRGIAILLVVVGHLWVHVSSNRAVPVLGDYGVSLFLILSGFGLVISNTKERIGRNFFAKRFSRVIVPYWLLTVILLLLDYLLLHRAYPRDDIILTFAGVNLSKELKQIDYTRWFITLLLVFYIGYFLSYRFFNKSRALLCLFILALALCLLTITKVFQLGTIDQLIAFPIGCLTANYYERVSQMFHRGKPELLAAVIFGTTTSAFFVPATKSSFIVGAVVLGFKIVNSISFCALLILLIGRVGKRGYVSYFLCFCGVISYEIYLIHGPFLIKYNPIMRLFSPDLILVSFLAFLSLAVAVSCGLHYSLRLLMGRPAS